MIRIAIIEDQAIILEGLRLIINQIPDFKVEREFSNGKEFIDNIDSIKPDIVLSDIDMPVMNGIETVKNALRINPDLKIIALTMYDAQKYYRDMIRAGAKGFVLKQSSVEDLENAIREVYNGRNFFSPLLLNNILLEVVNNDPKITKSKNNHNLSTREMNLLQLICEGLTNKEIGDRLFLSIKTIESNKAKLLKKAGVKNNAGLIIWAIKQNIVKL